MTNISQAQNNYWQKLKQNKRYEAFTLLETLFVLIIYSLFFSIASLNFQNWQENLALEHFLSTVEKNLLFTQQMAITQQKDTEVRFSEDEQCFYFLPASNCQQILRLPQSIKFEGASRQVFIGKTGNSSIHSYCFYLEEKGIKVVLQFQLGSGKYAKKIQPI